MTSIWRLKKGLKFLYEEYFEDSIKVYYEDTKTKEVFCKTV
jgi:hypothetical protein